MKSYLLLLPLCAAFAACAPQPPMQAPPPTVMPTPVPQPELIPPTPALPIPVPQPEFIPPTPALPLPQAHLPEVQLDTDLSSIGAPMDWIQIFSAITFSNASSPNNLGFSNRVASFGSAAALKADSLARLNLMTDVPAAKKAAIANAMVERATSKVDFNTQDLIVIYLTDGGPPFGAYRYSMVGDAMEFCIDKAPNQSGISGMALSTTIKFYAAPKGLKAKQCGA